ITEGLATVLRAFAGYITDKFHKKKAITMIGYSSAFFYKIGIIFSVSWVGVFFSKLVDRIGKGLRTAPRDSLIAESAKGGLGKNYGLHKMFDMLGATLGVLLAYIILVFSAPYKTVFYVSLVPAVIGVFILTFVKENRLSNNFLRLEKSDVYVLQKSAKTSVKTSQDATNFATDEGCVVGELNANCVNSDSRILSNSIEVDSKNVAVGAENVVAVGAENVADIAEKASATPKKLRLKDIHLSYKIWLYLLFLFIFSVGNSSNAFLLLKAQNGGVSATNILLFYLLYNLVASIFAIPFGKLSDKVGKRNIIVGAYLVFAVVYLCFGLFANTAVLAVMFGVYGLYTALVSGAEKGMMVEMVPKEIKGTALGLQGVAQGIGLLVSSMLAGALWQYVGSDFPFYFGAGVAVFSAIAMFVILHLPNEIKKKKAV
ncbi:MAG: MFS transporter, partial [Clostridia bacterium]